MTGNLGVFSRKKIHQPEKNNTKGRLLGLQTNASTQRKKIKPKEIRNTKQAQCLAERAKVQQQLFFFFSVSLDPPITARWEE